MSRVLLVEDLPECQLIVQRSLANSDMQLTVASSIEMALNLLRRETEEPFELIILDLSFPEGDGFMILEEVRHSCNSEMPVILLTSSSELDSKLTAFNLGADDFLVKPVSGMELRARAEMRIRKASKKMNSRNLLQVGNLELEPSLLRASLREGEMKRPLPLTAKEFKILACLAEVPHRVYSRGELIMRVWGQAVHVLDRTVDSHIFGLRKKLGDATIAIECVPYLGYRLIDDSQNLGSKPARFYSTGSHLSVDEPLNLSSMVGIPALTSLNPKG